MASQDRSSLLLAVARALYVNGNSTDQVVRMTGRLAAALGNRVVLGARWGELELFTADGDGRHVASSRAEPTGVNMVRVVATTGVVEEIIGGRRAPDDAMPAVAAAAARQPAPTWLFTLAAGAGAASLAVIFGAQRPVTMAGVFIAAALGALLRRGLARISGNLFIQPFCAALLAGLIGAAAVRLDLGTSLRLIAVAPCMVLVPGPHVLNSAMDLISGRIALGGARLLYAGITITAVSTGLLLGLTLLGVGLPIEGESPAVALWLDMTAAGVVVVAYSIFFSTPPRMLPWPVVIGVLAHGLHWAALAIGFGSAIATLASCLLVGIVLTPVARHYHMPFAGIGFAAVVALVPGLLCFRMASGVIQIASTAAPSTALIAGTISDGATAFSIVLAMSLGLVVPKLIIDRFAAREA